MRLHEDNDTFKEHVNITARKKHIPFDDAKEIYEKLHDDILYTDEKQIFSEAIEVFEQINEIFKSIDE